MPTALDQVYDALPLAPGARTLVRALRRLGYRFAIVCGGFSQITDRLAADLGIHYSRANELEIVDGVLTGRIVGRRRRPGRQGRRAARRSPTTSAYPLGAHDRDRRRRQRPRHAHAAGLGIAFNAKAVVREAPTPSVNVPYLDAIMYLLGISREEIEAADAERRHRHAAPPRP